MYFVVGQSRKQHRPECERETETLGLYGIEIYCTHLNWPITIAVNPEKNSCMKTSVKHVFINENVLQKYW